MNLGGHFSIINLVTVIFGYLEVKMSALRNESECGVLEHERYEDRKVFEGRSLFQTHR
jgi:hypothetical protein